MVAVFTFLPPLGANKKRSCAYPSFSDRDKLLSRDDKAFNFSSCQKKMDEKLSIFWWDRGALPRPGGDCTTKSERSRNIALFKNYKWKNHCFCNKTENFYLNLSSLDKNMIWVVCVIQANKDMVEIWLLCFTLSTKYLILPPCCG